MSDHEDKYLIGRMPTLDSAGSSADKERSMICLFDGIASKTDPQVFDFTPEEYENQTPAPTAEEYQYHNVRIILNLVGEEQNFKLFPQ